MFLTIVRHADVVYPSSEELIKMPEHPDVKLLPEGKERANKLPKSLERFKPSEIICSPKIRARETSQPSEKHFKLKPIIYDGLTSLIVYDIVKLSMALKLIENGIYTWQEAWFNENIGTETPDDFLDRNTKGFKWIKTNVNPKGNKVLFAHAETIWAAERIFSGGRSFKEIALTMNVDFCNFHTYDLSKL